MSTAVIQSRYDPPAFVRPVELSAALSDAILTAQMAAEEALSSGHFRPTRADTFEAARVLPRAEQQCQPGDARMIAQWMERLRALPYGPKTPDEAKAAVASAIAANGDLPAAVWTAETAAEALRTLLTYPAPAVVRELLLPHAKRFWRVRDGLRRVAGHKADVPPQRQEPTAEAKAAVSEMVAAFVAERAAAREQAPDAKPTVTPKHLSDGQLLAIYEEQARQGVQGLETRIRVLRERVAQ